MTDLELIELAALRARDKSAGFPHRTLSLLAEELRIIIKEQQARQLPPDPNDYGLTARELEDRYRPR